MAGWLKVEEAPFGRDGSLPVGPTRGKARRPTVTISLRGVRIVDNKKLFGSAQVRVMTIVVDGNRDDDGEAPFWKMELEFPNVRDGATLPIDPEFGYLVYQGRPWDFASLFVLIARDAEATRRFVRALKDTLLAEGIGAAAGAATIFAGAPMVADAARRVTTSLVDATLEAFSKGKNPLIATYYGSVTRNQAYGAGLHPDGYPGRLIDCGGTAELAYEITSS